MRLLYLCHRLPYPPNKGDRLRAYHHLRHLGRRHEVHLVTLADRRRDAARATPLAEHCSVVECFPRSRPAALLRCLAALPTGRSLTIAYFRSPTLVRHLRELAHQRRFDAVVAYCSSMAPYACLFEDLPLLLDLVDLDSAKWAQYARFAGFPMRAVYALEARRLRRFESRLHRRFDCVLLTTRRELSSFREVCPQAHAVVARNGIDARAFACPTGPTAPRPTLVFLGQMDYFPNVDGVLDFARQVLPALRERHRDLELLIVGRSPTRKIRALAREPGVRVTGEVDDPRPYLARAWIFVAPLRLARGVQNKVLEAMAMGLPAVCSPRVASGLADAGFQAGRHLAVADDPAAWIDTISRLLADDRLRRRIGRAARRRLELRCSWEDTAQRLEEQLEAAVLGRRPAPRQQLEIA